MSLERNIERIADSLEAINNLLVERLPGQIPPPQETVAPKRAKKPAPVVEDVIPGVEEVVEDDPIDSAIGTAFKPVANGAELRTLAQRYIEKAGDQTNALVTFIRSVAAIFNPKEPKLIKIPDAKASEAAAMIENWCKKEKIVL